MLYDLYVKDIFLETGWGWGKAGEWGVQEAAGSALQYLPVSGHGQMQLTLRERNCHGGYVNTCLGALINHGYKGFYPGLTVDIYALNIFLSH